MTDDPKSTFAKRVRAAKPRPRKYDVWDDVITGLGLRVGTSGHRSFFLRRSVRGRIRSATIGSADTMTVPEARAEARKLIATFINPARKHNGPRTPDRPMDAFAGEFLDRQARHWKPRTLESNTYMVRKYILPAFGHMTVDAIAVVIARHGEMELGQARRRARDMLGRIRAGENPAEDIQREKETPTFRQFAEEYRRRCERHWKPSGRKTVRIYLNARILPTFGRMPLDRIGPEDVAAWFDAASRAKPGAANRAFEILRAMMFRAEEWGLRERGTNPCLGIAKNPRNNVARFLDADELAPLGRALDARSTPARRPLDAREARWPEAVAAIRLLALTGCRRSKVLNLRWYDIGANAINLRDSKTGPRAVPFGEAARAHIRMLRGARDPEAYLFPRHAEGRGQSSLTACWRAVCEDANLGRLRLNDFRHTAASHAVMSG